jgi:hypothetical protein
MALQQGRQRSIRPVEQLAMQLQCICSFSVIVTLQMQVTQFIHIANIHLFAIDLTVEVLFHDKSNKTWMTVFIICVNKGVKLKKKMLYMFITTQLMEKAVGNVAI